MQNFILLRSVIQRNMRRLGYNFSGLSEKTGISRGTLSGIFVRRADGFAPLSFDQLTRITTALGFPEDFFYPLYIEECFFGGRPNRSRIEPFVESCIRLGRPDALEQVLNRLEDEPRYLPLLFEIAERRQEEETKPQTERLYEYILIHNRDRHSAETAICHYRLFMLRLGEDGERNLKALNAFSPYRVNLPAELKLDALLVMGCLLYGLMESEELERIADEFVSLCLRLFGTRRHPPARTFNPAYPLGCTPAAYYGYSHMLKQAALCDLGRFREAASCSDRYENLSWLSQKENREQSVVRELGVYAKANRLGCRLMNGERNVLPDYIRLLEEHPEEIVPGLIAMVEAANRFGFSVDEWLNRFSPELRELLQHRADRKRRQLDRNRFARLLYQLSVYHWNRGRKGEAHRRALESWELSRKLNNNRMFRLLASLTTTYSGTAGTTGLREVDYGKIV
ncbi:hypothetical protein QWJ34_10235 [Saccharibacillus sp. CPCC 101409]|uniref:hypothetical protein n=1 Tax=Saccharibacillus sp. CPCC 101409 TaxID=3058041 RepID=UPI002673357D|nr:hypothetical protein [Saccharibacillus sp. CPCC 101409]MDO3410139.1 hypothetical protein [Saccharibacillus sp. CPCC 101409]